MLDNTRRYEMIVRPKGRTPADEYQHNGAVWIEGRDGNSYTIDIRNNTMQRALFIVSVDGLDVIQGQPAGPQSQGYVVGANETVSIPGWKLNSTEAAEFYFSRARDSYVNSLGGTTTNTGVIGAMVFQEYVEPMRYHTYTSDHVNKGVGAGTFTRSAMIPPWNHAYQAQNIGSYQGTSSGATFSQTGLTHGLVASSVVQDVGTGFGQAVDWRTNSVQFKRANANHPDAVVVLYYNTAKNLERMGIKLRTKRDVSYQANPFPGYSSGGCTPPADWEG